VKPRRAAALALVGWYLIVPSRPLSAEIYKLAIPSDQGIELHWWPQLSVPDGWVHDEGASRSTGTNILVPKGQSFSEAPAVMYGEALYKPRMPEVRSLDQLVSEDKRKFQAHVPGILILPLPPLKNGDGRSLRCFSYSPPQRDAGKVSWEWTAYSEEGDFYLIFVVSAKSEAALKTALPSFRRVIATYKEKGKLGHADSELGTLAASLGQRPRTKCG
jgi:hypothetical protein